MRALGACGRGCNRAGRRVDAAKVNGMPLDRSLVRALCFDIDGTLADTDDHIVARLAALLDAVPLVSGRRAERLARQAVMAAETPVHAAYAKLDELGLDVPLSALHERLRAIRRRAADPAHARNPQAIDEVPHEMIAGVKEMIVALARRYPMCSISTGGAPRVDRFLRQYGVREHFVAVVGAQTTRRMKPHPEPLLFAAAAMGVAPQDCLMIGDTTIDIRTGVSAGAQTVGVLCGFGTERELRAAGAHLILRTTSDLLGVLSPADDPLETSASPDPDPAGAAP
jgi:HAD superfamily hydrolase (TIGR01509 family)